MKRNQKILAMVMTVLLVGGIFGTALAADADFGSAGVVDNQTYTLSEMLTYAIQDEYLAQAEYAAIMDAFGEQRPFSNIIKAEGTHIAELTPLFTAYGVTLPENTAQEYVAVPASLLEAYQAGVTAEIKNIAMYDTFLAQDLPDDVRAVFLALRNASENHLTAFQRGAARSDGTSGGSAGGRGKQTNGKNR